ncbi:MAG: SsrA-binding protein SmpB [Patescibacteria group bacterium]|jgi:SsrA-binding protein|nr:SsrA-binding protein SmpB [Patescibacteria group bacterium]
MKRKHKKNRANQITNRRASFDYTLEDEFIVGIALNGREVKNLRLGHGNLRGAYITIKDNELYIINLTINGTSAIPIPENEQTIPRKLLANKKEIDKLIQAKTEGRTIIPVAILNKARYIKLKIAIAKGKKKYDKRQAQRKKDDQKLTSYKIH